MVKNVMTTIGYGFLVMVGMTAAKFVIDETVSLINPETRVIKVQKFNKIKEAILNK